MQRHRLVGLLVAVAIIAVTGLIVIRFVEKTNDCSDLGGTLSGTGRMGPLQCHLPDGSVIAM